MKLKTELRHLIVKLSAACIFCDRVKMTAPEELAILKAGIDSPLFEDLQALAHKLSNTRVRIPIMGPVKSGKSTALNAIVAQRLSPSDTQPLTVLPMVIEHAPGLELPTLSVPFIELYNKAAARVQAWLNTPCLCGANALLRGEIRLPSDKPQLWKLVKPEMKLFNNIVETGKLGVTSRTVLTTGPQDAHDAVEKLNRLCRIYARVHLFLIQNVIEPYDRLEELYKSLPMPWGGRRVRLLGRGKSKKQMQQQTSSLQDLYCDANELVQKFHIISSTEASAAQPPGAMAGGQSWWFADDYDEKQQWFKQVLSSVEDTLEKFRGAVEQVDVQEWDIGLLGELLQAGSKEKKCPWPRMQYNIAIFAQSQISDMGGREMPTAIEIIDTPGLDESDLLPAITNIVKLLMEEAQANIFVCNTRVLGTDAFNEATVLVKEALAFEVPILVLANYMDGMTDKRRSELCKDVAKSIFDSEASTSKVYPVSARSAFLSNRLQLLQDDDCLVNTCNKLLKHLDQSDNSDDQEPSSQMEPDVEDLFTALGMVSPIKLEPEEREGVDGGDLAQQIVEEHHIRYHKRKGGFGGFVDDIQKKLAPKALAMEAQGSLKRLTTKNGMLFKMLAVVGDAVAQILETQAAQEQNEKLWVDFLLAAQGLALKGFNSEYSLEASGNIATILGEVQQEVAKKKFKAFVPDRSLAKDDGGNWTVASQQNLAAFQDEALRHAGRIAREFAAEMRAKATTRLQHVWDRLNSNLQKDVDVLDCPKAGLKSLLQEAKLNVPSKTLSDVTLRQPQHQTSHKTKTWTQWFLGRPADVAGHHISKQELDSAIKVAIESSLLEVTEQYQEGLAKAPSLAVDAYKEYISNLVNAAHEQHKDIQQQRTSPTFTEAKATLLEVYEVTKECYMTALGLQQEIQEDPFEI